MASTSTLASSGILPADNPPHPVETIAGDPACGVVLLCDHASNEVPADLDNLGPPPEQLERHIGYDIGAADVVRELARKLGAPAVLTRFSRLVIDPNRGRDDPYACHASVRRCGRAGARIDDDGIAGRIRRFYDPMTLTSPG